MKPIYEPKGKAKEYGDYALNIYTGCPHRCYYCFAPSVLHRDREKFHADVRPRDGIVEAAKAQLEKEHISTSVPTRRMTAIQSVRLARGTARHGLKTRHTMRLDKCLRWSKRKQSKNTRSASGENLLSQNVPIQSAICKSSLNSSRESSSGCMRSTLRPASQRRNISSEKLRWTPR